MTAPSNPGKHPVEQHDVPSQKRAWYREPLVWLVIAFPLAAVIGGIAIVTIALNQDDGQVIDDYYRKGKEINRVFDRDEAARERGLSALTRVDAATGAIAVDLTQTDSAPLPHHLVLQLIHSTRGHLDQRIDLLAVGPGNKPADKEKKYAGKLKSPLTAGHWRFQIGTPEWRLSGSAKASPRIEVKLLPVL